MHLVQLLLPLYDEAVAHDLTERFGGLTAYTRAPAKGVWKPPSGGTERDDIVVYEVMVEVLDRPWWARYRVELEARLQQKEIVIRAHAIERL
jgi:hypothetical protein